jgi:anion-transporting  ArsA/GET3 family ATPase
MSALDDRLSDLRVIVCVGSGGAGKTTVAATVALGLAAQGRRVALVTIDPARRLAEALGLDELGNDPQRVDPEPFASSGLELKGELSAMMLNVKRTFDELVERLAPDRRTLEQILANPVYNHLSTAVAGTQEYTALAKLFDIERGGAYDVIVLDTPPSRSAVDFLLAPQRLTAFLEGRALSVFLRPTGTVLRVAGLVSGALRRIVGVAMLDDLTSFFRLLSGLMDGFRSRAAEIQSLLGEATTGFLIVTSGEAEPIEEAIFLGAELDKLGMHRTGVIVNRVHPLDPSGADMRRTTERLTPPLGGRLAAQVARKHAELQLLATREQDLLVRLRDVLDEPNHRSLGDRGEDVHDVPGLVALQQELFGVECRP